MAAPKTFPAEFEAMLSPRGLRVLAGEDDAVGALARGVFFSADDLLDPRRVRAGAAILERAHERVEQITSAGERESTPRTRRRAVPDDWWPRSCVA